MPKVRPVQASFSTGEISPSMLFRNDIPNYKQACAKLRNFEVTAGGPALRRDGTMQLATGDSDWLGSRAIAFNISPGEAYVLVIGKLGMLIFEKGGPFGSENLISNGQFLDDDMGWTSDTVDGSSVEYADGVCFLDGGIEDTMYSKLKQTFTVDTAEIANQHTLKIKANNSQGTTLVKLGTADGLDDILSSDFSGRSFEVKFTPGQEDVFLELEFKGGQKYSEEAGTPENPPPLVDVLPKEIDYVAVYKSQGASLVTTPWTTLKMIEDIQTAQSPEKDTLYFVSHETIPHRLIYDKSTRTFTFEEVTFEFGDDGDTTPVPNPNPWENSPPASIAFFGGRLFLGGSDEKTNAVWGSKAGDYLNFDFFNYTSPGTPDPNAETALNFTIKEPVAIQWMRGATDLEIGTTGNNVTIKASGNFLTFADAEIKQQSVYGSNRVQGVAASNGMLWMNPEGKRLYYSIFDNNPEKNVAIDLSFQADHFLKVGVKELTVKKTPDQKIYIVLKNGEMVCLCFDPLKNLIGWYKIETQGKIRSVCVVEEQGVDIVYVIAERNNMAHLERMTNEVYMDNAVRNYFDPPVSVVGGLEHLEGQTVQVLVDGAMQLDKVVTGGEVELERPGNDVTIGLQYTSEIKTLPVEFMVNDESTAPLKKRFSRIFLRFNASALPIVNGENVRKRHPATLMGLPEGVISGDLKVANLGWDRYGSIQVTQELPYRTEVLGLYGEMGLEGMQ